LLMGIMAKSENRIPTHQEKIYHGFALSIVIFVMGLLLIPVAVLGTESVGESVIATQIFHPPDPDVLDGFGMAIAGHQSVVLVGAPNDVHNGREAGRAYVLDRRTGALIHALGSPSPTGGALFGQSGALNGRFAAIGAPHGRDGEGTYTGGVYVYDPVTGKHTMTITNPYPVTGTFGHAIAMHGQKVVVGDPQASTETTYYTGATYVFDVTTGERLLTLHPSKSIPGKPSWFGHAVDFSDSMIVIGAPNEQIESIPAGVVYGFNAETGAFIRTFVSPHPTESFFGWSVAVAEDLLLVGGFGFEGTYREEGIVYAFHAASGKLIRTLHNPDPQEGAHFGKSVAILPKFLIVGAPGDSANEKGMTGGAIYVFDRTTGKFLEKVVNPANPTGADDVFGFALATIDEHLLVGAPFGGKGTELDAGLVYEFDFNPILTCPFFHAPY
jgi:outer membrane protein assembly factor BamB